MTKEEIIQAISDDKMMPFIQSEQLAGIVDFVIKNYNPSIPSNLDEAAEESAKRWRKNPDGSESREMLFQPHIRGFKAGAEWMAGQFEKNRPTWKKCEDGNTDRLELEALCREAGSPIEIAFRANGYRIFLSDLEKLPKEE